MSHMTTLVRAGELLNDIAHEQAVWSQATFGPDSTRGPIGALKHLELEAKEAQAKPADPVEYADCFLLVLDAARRAGIKPIELMEAAYAKLQVCKQREWPPAIPDEAVEHVRDPDEGPATADLDLLARGDPDCAACPTPRDAVPAAAREA